MYIIYAMLLGIITGMIAKKKGKSFGLWWIYGSLLFIVALPHALIMSENERVVEKRKIDSGEMKKCPYCAELIKKEAIKCRYCNSDLSNDDENRGYKLNQVEGSVRSDYGKK